MPASDALDAAWESVPSSPTVAVLDPIEKLKRIFRGAIAANPALWRSVDLEDAVLCLDQSARQRPTALSPIAVEPVRKRLVKMHAPKLRLFESLLAFAAEARDAGFVVVLPLDVDALNESEKKKLLGGFYARLAEGGLGADARNRSLAGELIILTPPPRSTRLAQVLAVMVAVFGLSLLLDDAGRGDTRPRASAVVVPADALPCEVVERQGTVLRCTINAGAEKALRAQGVDDERRRFERTRQLAVAEGLKDALVVDSNGSPLTPRASR